ncbi:hypothetical protein Trydic_g4720 [Trypoxylus dichotomus]
MNEEGITDNVVEVCEMHHPKICSPIANLNELFYCLKQPPLWTDGILKLKNRSDHVIKNTDRDCHTEDYNFIPTRRLNKNFVPKTLVCHDMKNGYLEDKYVGRVNVGNRYTFYRWSQIDIFVYFSHHFITVPPLAWINLAHKNGVPILGTFITEWDAGKTICNEIFKDVETLENTATALVELCLLFHLDGWLLNIENKVENPQNLQRFVQFLTDQLHAKKSNSYIIWYDSVTRDGKLQWQNELNEYNRCFFDACDGIFLNYTWKKGNLKRSIKHAQHRRHDVYVGLDVFGRGCFGGGKFNSYLAAKAVREHDLSLAIFAQGWTHETLDQEPQSNFLERFHIRDNTWWNTLWTYLYSHPIKYAFQTVFQVGTNDHFYDLQTQTQQLTNFLSCNEISETEVLHLLEDKCLCLKDNIKNGTRMCHVSNKDLLEKDNVVHRLFSTDIFLNGTYSVYCYTKVGSCDYKVILLLQNKYQHVTKIVCHSNSQKDGDYQEAIVEIIPSFNIPPTKNVPEDWTLRSFEINFYEDTILEIGISLPEGGSLDLCGFGITVKE